MNFKWCFKNWMKLSFEPRIDQFDNWFGPAFKLFGWIKLNVCDSTNFLIYIFYFYVYLLIIQFNRVQPIEPYDLKISHVHILLFKSFDFDLIFAKSYLFGTVVFRLNKLKNNILISSSNSHFLRKFQSAQVFCP